MADTGAPWNIPYAEPSDLVRDWPALSEDVAEAISDALDTRTFGQIIQTVKTDTFITTLNQGASTGIPDLTVSITPTSNTAKVLVLAQVVVSRPEITNSAISLRLLRGSSAIGVGAAASNRRQETTGSWPQDALGAQTMTIIFLDSPATESSTTYGVALSHGRAGTDNVAVNRTFTDTDANNIARYASTITAIEVAA
jgi:hypothetical protein